MQCIAVVLQCSIEEVKIKGVNAGAASEVTSKRPIGTKGQGAVAALTIARDVGISGRASLFADPLLAQQSG
jgi:hypothetical protein